MWKNDPNDNWVNIGRGLRPGERVKIGGQGLFSSGYTVKKTYGGKIQLIENPWGFGFPQKTAEIKDSWLKRLLD